MPLHSSKNYYKAELDQNEQDEEKEWQNICNSFFTGHSSHCRWAYECACRDVIWSNAFNTEWTKNIGYSATSRCKYCFDEQYRPLKVCPHIRCSCDYCYEMKHWGAIEIVKKYFTPEQILEYNSSLPVKYQKLYCTTCDRIYHENIRSLYNNGLGLVCMNRVFSINEFNYRYCLNKIIICPMDKIIKTINLYKHLLSACTPPVEIKEINMDMISGVTLEYFMNHHKQTILEYHQQEKQKEQKELLNKYGVGLEEYKKYRLERQLQIEAQTTPLKHPAC